MMKGKYFYMIKSRGIFFLFVWDFFWTQIPSNSLGNRVFIKIANILFYKLLRLKRENH